MSHAQFSPSAAHRWINCPASIEMEKLFPSSSSSHADEGSAAHAFAAYCLRHGDTALAWQGFPVNKLDESIDQKWIITEEMVENVQVYLDYVRNQPGDLMAEQRVEFSKAIGVPEQFGTSDAIIVNGDELIIVDLKYGMGVKVNAEYNAQLMLYAVGALETFAELCEWDIKRIRLVVCQPRLNHIDEWECPLTVMEAFVEDARRAVEDTLAVNPDEIKATFLTNDPGIFNPAEKTCRWCRARAVCPGYTAAVSEEVFDDFQAINNPDCIATNGAPSVPILARLGNSFSILPFIEDWCKAVRQEVERRVFNGESIIGADGLALRLAEGRKGHRVWTDEETAKGVLTGLLPPDKVFKPQEIITPSAADKLLNKKKTKATWDDMVAPLIKTPPGSPKVVLGSDPAPPYSGEAKVDEFDVVTEE